MLDKLEGGGKRGRVREKERRKEGREKERRKEGRERE